MRISFYLKTGLLAVLVVLMVLPSVQGQAEDVVLDTLLVQSSILGRDVQVYHYANQTTPNQREVCYLTDGMKMIQAGVLDRIIAAEQQGMLKQGHLFFVSTIDPQGTDHRNEYFFCNEDYIRFFEKELIPQMETMFKIQSSPVNRSIAGMSYGGMNAAFFSAEAQQFKGFGLLSPFTGPCAALPEKIEKSSRKDIRVYMNTGKNDAEAYVGPLETAYKSNAADLLFKHTKGGHDFNNWNPLIVEMLSHIAGS